MSPIYILITLGCYIAVLFLLGFLSGRGSDNASFFIGGRATSWYMATLAMIGAAMSGVTYISVAGSVAADSFSYMQMVVGFTIGQLIVAVLLVPLFYKQGVVSLYQYLDQRFDHSVQRVGAWCFLVSKLIGSSLKIYIVCAVMQILVFDYFNLSFSLNLLLTMLLVWLYTRWGGVRSLIITDTLQSLCLVGSIVVVIIYLCRAMGLGATEAVEAVKSSPYSQMWFFDDSSSPRYFWKMVVGGALCLVAMTGLDQDMMQRNLSCRTRRDSQINIVLTALCQAFVILLFLSLGALLYRYMDFASLEVPAKGDEVFAKVAVQGGLPLVVGIVFIVGLISSTYSAAGSALTSLTTSFTLDIMQGDKRLDSQQLTRLRHRVHLTMAAAMAAVVMAVNMWGSDSIINVVFRVAGYTYGPILGLFLFGILTTRALNGRILPVVVLVAPLLSYLLQWWCATNYNYHIGFELLGYNTLFTIFGLAIISKRTQNNLR